MNKLKFGLVYFMLLLSQLAYSQDIVKRKTLSIIDTTQTKLEQAHTIYSWITKNINYDVKEYLKGNSKEYSSYEILKKKKGICYDYSSLFKEMCNSVGIETYIVSGYSKGVDYYRGGGFYRAEHCWNLINIDTSWYFVDATWGSGYVKRVPVSFDKIKFILFREPFVNKKLVFVKSPTDRYFNPQTEITALSHMPLDPKWQLKAYPYSIKSFENDTLLESISYLNYKEEILNSKDLFLYQQLSIEGINGKAFNSKNDADIAYGLLLKANELNVEETKLDSITLPLFKDNLSYYQKAQGFVAHYRFINDSIFNHRLNFLKKEGQGGRKIATALKSKLKNVDDLYLENQKKLVKKNDQLNQKVVRLEKLIEIESLKKYNGFKVDRMLKPDSTIIELNKISLERSIHKFNIIKREIDSLSVLCDDEINSDSIYSADCLENKRKLIDLTYNFRSKLITEDNLIILSFWKVIKSNYSDLMVKYKNKGRNLASIRFKYSKVNTDMNLIFAEFQTQLKLISKLNSYSCDQPRLLVLTNELHDLWIESIKIFKNLTKRYLLLTQQLTSFNIEDYQTSQHLKGIPIQNITLFAKFVDVLHSNQKRTYINEKVLIKNLEKDSKSGLKRLNSRISVFENEMKSKQSKLRHKLLNY